MSTSSIHSAIAAALPALQGWCSLDKATAMADLITAARPALVVEIGVFGGRSLIPQAMALKALGAGVIYGIDPWRREANLEGINDPANDEWWAKLDIEAIQRGAFEAIWSHGLQSHAALIRARSQTVTSLFPLETIDILHLDGNHSSLSSCRDVRNYLPKLRPGGHLWFDDVNWATTAGALALVDAECDVVRDIITEGQHCRLFRKR